MSKSQKVVCLVLQYSGAQGIGIALQTGLHLIHGKKGIFYQPRLAAK
jgi:cobalamin biosynthesis protein CbiD